MESYLQDWLSLLLRWAHFITGVAWIGASFYFNWLENHLQRQNVKDPLAGDLWAVHGGGFYYLQKYRLAPDQLPATLHWFKWEAYFTWLTGFALLCTIYYWNPGLFMVDRAVADITPQFAVVLGLTNTPAFSMRGFTDNPLHGATYNPWDPDRTCGGANSAELGVDVVDEGVGGANPVSEGLPDTAGERPLEQRFFVGG